MKLMQAIDDAAQRMQAAGLAFGHGTTNAHDEAVWLVLWACKRPLDEDLDALAEHTLSADDQRAIEGLLQQRIGTRRPLAYLTGEAWLQGLPFHIDARSIVPRSLIAEVLAEGLIDDWLERSLGRTPRRVLDLCTGNGSLAVLAALAWPQAEVHGSDIDAAALEVAALNIQRHAPRVQLYRADGLSAPNAARFDLILCNPPYVNSGSMAELPPEYRAEPALALEGGADGMDFIRPLLAALPQALVTGGALVLEIGHERSHFEAAFPQLEPIWLPCSAGDDQVLLLLNDAGLVAHTAAANAPAGGPSAPAAPIS
jgi:ribosomal protein L3 glutamine methyltransferase